LKFFIGILFKKIFLTKGNGPVA